MENEPTPQKPAKKTDGARLWRALTAPVIHWLKSFHGPNAATLVRWLKTLDGPSPDTYKPGATLEDKRNWTKLAAQLGLVLLLAAIASGSASCSATGFGEEPSASSLDTPGVTSEAKPTVVADARDAWYRAFFDDVKERVRQTLRITLYGVVLATLLRFSFFLLFSVGVSAVANTFAILDMAFAWLPLFILCVHSGMLLLNLASYLMIIVALVNYTRAIAILSGKPLRSWSSVAFGTTILMAYVVWSHW